MNKVNPTNEQYFSKERLSEIVALLLRCRSEKGYALHEVASALDMSQGAISNIERGVAVPRKTTWLKLENFLRKNGYAPRIAA